MPQVWMRCADALAPRAPTSTPGAYDLNDRQLNDLFAQCVDDDQLLTLMRKLGW